MSLLKISLFFFSSITFFLIVDFIHFDWFALLPGQIDSWVYWGTGEVFQYVKFHFSHTYYFRRWTVTLINYLFSNTFEPYLAIYFKNIFLLVINLFISILLIYKLTKSFFLSLIFLIFFLPFGFYFYSIGQNYNQATGIFFINLILLSTFLFSLKHKYVYFIYLGFVIFCTLVTYQYLIYVIFSIIFFWFIINYKLLISLNSKNIFFIILFIFLGLFLGILLEYSISVILGVKWQNFFIYSLSVSRTLMNIAANHSIKFYTFYIFQEYSFIIAAIFISFILLRISIFNKSKKYLAFSVLLLVLTLTHLMDPVTKANSIFTVGAIFYLFAFCLFGMILILNFIISDYKILSKIFFIGLIFIIILLILKYVSVTPFFIHIKFTLLILLFLSFLIFKKKAFQVLLMPIFLTLYLLLIINTNSYAIGKKTFQNQEDIKIYINKISSEIKEATKKAIEYDPLKPRRLWILDNRPHRGWSGTITSLYGNFSAINAGYGNNAVACNQIDWILMFPNSVLVTYGFDTETDSLNKLTDLFKPCGSFVFEKSIKIKNAHTFTVKKIN
jgi:hypothetical protein